MVFYNNINSVFFADTLKEIEEVFNGVFTIDEDDEYLGEYYVYQSDWW